jgi:hypothetical protein
MPSRGHEMNTVETYFAPEKLQGPYADFYRRAITELLCWRLLRDGSEHMSGELTDFTQDPLDPLAFDAIGIQFGQA